MSEIRLYRGQPKEYRCEPLMPSALRHNCIEYMEGELSRRGIDVMQYLQKCEPHKMPQQYCNPDYKPAIEAFYVYWLSLVNCAIAVNENPICFKFCKSYAFTKNLDKDKVGAYGLSSERIAEVCFGYAKDFFDSDQSNETYHLLLILPDYAFFQHFNHALSKLDKNQSTLFPTLALDWTWDISTAERFADTDTKKGTILSISWEAYEKWNLTRNFKVCNINNGENRIPTFGFESYMTTPPWNIYNWHSQDNNLMIEQKGAVIFWPWKYTIDQLRENALGKALDFVEVER
jgi:hypothetical protein